MSPRPRRRGPVLLDVRAIDAYYGPIQALRGVSLSVGEGERVALVGANGAGKSTTLRCISGLVPHANGEIVFDGEPLAGLTPDKIVERGIAQLPEGRELFSSLSVEDNLKAGFWTQWSGGDSYEHQRDLVMDHFPILRQRAKQAAGTLSGGEQQMLGVARALMSGPRLLVVDELSLGLAPMIVEQLYDILREINATGTAVLIVEQFVDMALSNTDRAYVLAKGEVVNEGPSRQLLADPALVASYLGDVSLDEPASANGGRKPAARSRGRRR